MRPDFNLKQIGVFYYAAKYMNLTRAAEQLHVSQPAIASQVKSLERRLRTSLFVRKNNRLELTEAGALLFGYAERMVNIAREAANALDELGQTAGTILRIGTTKTIARHIMPSYIPPFQDQHPEIYIQFGDGNSRELVQSVLDNRIDLAIVGRITYGPELESMPFPGQMREELVLVLPPNHPLAAREHVSVAQLPNEPLILLPRGSGGRQTIEQAAQEVGVDLQIILEADSPDFIKTLVQRRAGISVLSCLQIEEEERNGSLTGVRFEGDGLHVPVDIVLAKGRPPRPAVSAFLEFLRERGQVALASGTRPG